MVTLLPASTSSPVPCESRTWQATLGGMRNLADMGADPLAFMRRIQAESGDVAWFWLGRIPAVLVNTPELAHALLVEHEKAFHKLQYLRVFMRPVLGNGLLTSEGDLHRRQRRLMAPVFNHARIAAYADIVAALGREWQAGWRDGQVVDIHAEMMALTLSIIGKVLFDTDVRADAGAVGTALTETMTLADRRASAMLPIPWHWPTPANQKFNSALARLDAIVYRIIEQRRREGVDRGDFLSVLLASQDEGSRMDDRQVRDEAMTLFLAGHETTANALTWTWALLARHPHVYRRLVDEVDRVLGNRPPDLSDLPSLPYTLQVFKEAMRLYPPAWMVGRTAQQDVDLGGLRVRQGTEVLLSIALLHRRAEAFPNPDAFEPERFSVENETRLPRYAYLPFGAGPRICIGNHFALMEGHLLLATLARSVRFEACDGEFPKTVARVTLRPRNAVNMRISRRS